MRERSVLVMGLSEAVKERIADALATAEFFVDGATTVEESLELVSLLPYDAIIVGFPIEDVPLKGLIGTIRSEGSPCRQASLVVLAQPDRQSEAEGYLGRGVNRVLPVDSWAEQLPQVLGGFLAIAPRTALRAVCRLLPTGKAKRSVLCQTENISSTGMLIRTNQQHPPGSEVKFELQLPGQQGTIVGVAEAVRTTTGGRERATGIGVRFVTFEKDGDKRLASFLAQRKQ